MQELTAAVPCVASAAFNFTNACEGEAVSFTDELVGAAQWLWDFGDPASGANNTSTDQNPTHTFSGSGTYTVSLTVSGCLEDDGEQQTLTIIAPPVPTLPDSLVLCESSTVLNPGAFAGANYYWITGATTPTLTVTNPNPNWYWVDITVGSCTVRDSVFVDLGNLSGSIWAEDERVVCGSSTVLNTGTVTGSTYNWSSGRNTPTLNVTTDGTYSVTVTQANGCQTIDTLTIDLVPSLNLDLGATINTCEESYVLDTNLPGIAYDWSTGAATQSITVTTSGNYAVTVTANGCSDVDTVEVNFEGFSLNVGDDQTLCNQTSVLLTPTISPSAGSYTYSWSTGAASSTLNVSTSGNYSLTVNNGTCTNTDDVQITFATGATVNLGNDTTLCAGSSLALDATAANATYQWSNGQNTPMLTVTDGNTYTVTVTTDNGCTATDAIEVTINTPAAIDFQLTEPFICPALGQVITLNAGAGQTFSWSPDGSSASTLSVTTPGTYSVTVTDAAGCTATQSITLTERCESLLLLPNAFSPNGDGANDVFKPLVQFVQTYEMWVYDRWGNQLFHSTNVTEGWDGTTTFSKPAEIGVYVWMVNYTDESEQAFSMKGNVTVVR